MGRHMKRILLATLFTFTMNSFMVAGEKENQEKDPVKELQEQIKKDNAEREKVRKAELAKLPQLPKEQLIDKVKQLYEKIVFLQANFDEEMQRNLRLRQQDDALRKEVKIREDRIREQDVSNREERNKIEARYQEEIQRYKDALMERTIKNEALERTVSELKAGKPITETEAALKMKDEECKTMQAEIVRLHQLLEKNGIDPTPPAKEDKEKETKSDEGAKNKEW